MEPFTEISSVVIPLDRANVDTDAIIPKQFMKSIQRTGFGDNLFDEWRYLDQGEPGQDASKRPRNSDFPLNKAAYQGARVLLARENFGCGSSREHACWALRDYGIRVIIAPSFGDIFYGNCIKNGLLPIALPGAEVQVLFSKCLDQPGVSLRIDLEAQVIDCGSNLMMDFEIAPQARQRLLCGLDDIAATLQRIGEIDLYEQARREKEPWLFR